MGIGSNRKSAKVPNPRAATRPAARAKALQGRPGERGRQVIRLLTVLRTLEASRRGLSIAEIHAALEERCTQRTVYRDVQQLSEAGFRLQEENGRWSLARDSQSSTQLFALQASEVLTLLISEDLLAPLSAGGLAATLPELRRRLMAGLSAEGRALVKELRGTIRGTHAAPVNLEQSRGVLDAIDEAIAKEQCLEIRYASPTKPVSQRIVEPHLLWIHAGLPYLVAFCRSSAAFKTFAIQRIEKAEVLDEVFDRDPNFDPVRFTELGFGALHGPAFEIVIEFDASVAHLARERRWHATQQIEAMSDGRVRLTMTAAGLPEVAAWIASFGGKVTAVAPEGLIGAVRALHEGGIAACGQGGRGD